MLLSLGAVKHTSSEAWITGTRDQGRPAERLAGWLAILLSPVRRVISTDRHIIKIWDVNTGAGYTSIEPPDGDINDVCVWPRSGGSKVPGQPEVDTARCDLYFVDPNDATVHWLPVVVILYALYWWMQVC